MAAMLGFALGGCGFQPLHGPSLSGKPMTEVLKSVDIAPIPGRVGQRIRNELIFDTQGGAGDGGLKAEYRLDIAIKEELRNTLVSGTGDPQGQIVEVNAEFKLVRISDNVVVFQGKSAGRAAFDKVESVFADIRAKQDAENRAARTIAEAIRLRITAYLSGSA
jgi:LPS-assembly lipoprotein